MDPESKLFYRKLLDFGPGVGFREGQRKYEEEMRKDEERKNIYNEDIAMNSEAQNFLNSFIDKNIDLAAGYSPLIPEGLRDKYKKEADIDKYLQNMKRLKKKGIV
tara:strand:- start:47 stop:361 length:315 start_codon:yes stop_codon:yes gene_type:complete